MIKHETLTHYKKTSGVTTILTNLNIKTSLFVYNNNSYMCISIIVMNYNIKTSIFLYATTIVHICVSWQYG